MRSTFPVRLGDAEHALIAQLKSVGADAVAERITVTGLPTRRVETYHYTDLKALLQTVPSLAQPANEIRAPTLRIPGAFQLIVANGVVQESAIAPAGIIIGKASGSALTIRDDVLVHLNIAFAKEALTLNLEGAVAPIIQIDRRIEGVAAHVSDAIKVFVADEASAVIVETFSGSDAAHMGNHASYLALGRRAKLLHVTINLSPHTSTHFATNEYQLADGAELRTLVIHIGSTLSRTHVFSRMMGAGAHADLTGLNLVKQGQHADITMEAVHAVPQTSSHPLFKSVARGRSRAVVQGKLIVARDAQKTDAKFMHQGLMLSNEAEILSKPELEIYADDVVCGHGSTCGKLDDDSLFYLLSRGISKAEAETMLVRGFIAEMLDSVEDEALNEILNVVVDGWLSS